MSHMEALEAFTHTDPHWTSPHWVAHADEAIRVLCFRSGPGVPVLIVPPQAGHHSNICDFAPGQSLVECAAAQHAGPVYAIEWRSCTFERRHEGIEDLLGQMALAVEVVGQPCHLIGLCQGGWLSAIHAAMRPESVASLTTGGAPIDTKAGDSSLHQATRLPLAFFQGLVAMGGGRMSGDLMLVGWKSSDPFKHYVARHFKTDERTRRFYGWYNHTQFLPGTLYLWIMDRFFQHNDMGRNELTIDGQHVDLHALRRIAKVNIVYGATDDITPAAQALALLRYVQGANIHEVDTGGHIGLFMSGAAVNGPWARLFGGLSEVAA